jgi:hypothetical protein
VSGQVEQAIDAAEAVLRHGLESSDLMVRLKAATALFDAEPGRAAARLWARRGHATDCHFWHSANGIGDPAVARFLRTTANDE